MWGVGVEGFGLVLLVSALECWLVSALECWLVSPLECWLVSALECVASQVFDSLIGFILCS